MGITLTNNAHTTLSADATSTDTIFYVEDIDSFPTLDVGDYFYCTIERTSGAMEIVKVTQINSSSFIVERGQENTIPISFPIGSLVSLKMTVQNITDLILTGSNINDDAYDSSWNGDTNDAPSRNAVYDKFVAVDAALAGYTAADVLAKLLTVDGTGSGLDADLLDGLSSAAYAQLSGAAFTGGISGTTASFSGASAFTSGALTVGFNKQTGDSALTLASDDNPGDSTSIIWTSDSVTKWYMRHAASNGSLFIRNNSLGTSALSFALASNNATFTGGVSTAGRNLFAGGPTTTPSAGAHNNATQISNTDTTYGLLLGSLATGVGFIQAQRVDGTGTTYGLSIQPNGGATTFGGTVSVPDDAYAAGWDGNLTVPTKNAVYDKIQSLGVLSDGDKGDITVSASGATWTIDNNTVTLAKMANLNQYELIGRSSASAGVPQAIATSANVYTLLGSANYAAFRSSLGLGTAALVDTGTSGTKVALTDGANTWSAAQTFNSNLTINKNDPVLYLIDSSVGGSGLFYTNESDAHRWGRTGVAYDMTLTNDTLAVGALNVSGMGTFGSAGIFLGGANNLATGIAIRSNAGYSRGLTFTTGASSARWYVETNSTAESGGNAGSDFTISNWDDAGAYIGNPFTITRSTGTTNISALAARVATSTETSGTLTSASANKQINATGNVTFNPSVFTAGDRGEIYAGSSSRTITQGTSMTLRLDGTATTGNRTLAAYGRASWYAVAHNEIIVTGVT